MIHTTLGVELNVPLFSVRDPESWGVRTSFTLPPPRTLLGALGRGLGIVLGFRSGEETINENGKRARDIITFVLEKHSIATVRPLSGIVKSSQMLRIVPIVEKGEKDFNLEKAHDAFKHDVVFTARMKAIYFIDIDSINIKLKEIGIREIKMGDLRRAIFFIDRIGSSENVSHLESCEELSIINEGSEVDTYFPLAWANSISDGYRVDVLLPNLCLMELLGIIKKADIKTLLDKELRRRKEPFVLPLKGIKTPKGREIFEPTRLRVKPKLGYEICSLSDGSGVVLPIVWVGES